MRIRILFSVFVISLCFQSQPSYADAYDAPQINRALFALEIIHKEPSQTFTVLPQAVDQVLFFSEVSGLAGHSIRHRWIYNNAIHSEVNFNIGADRWRFWSSKRMDASRTGTWTVQILDEYNNILASRSFNYLPASNQYRSY